MNIISYIFESKEWTAIFFTFMRLSGLFMLMPGIGELYVFVRARLMLVLSLSFFFGIEYANDPLLNHHDISIITNILVELLNGVIAGAIMRILFNLLDVIGSVIDLQIGFSQTLFFNTAIHQSTSLTSMLLSHVGVLLFFVTQFYQVIIKGIAASFKIMPIGTFALNFYDYGNLLFFISSAFTLGLSIAAPFLFVGLIFFLSIGIMSRLMPQIQLLFIMTPMQIILGLWLLAILITSVISRFFQEIYTKTVAFWAIEF